MAMSSKPTIIKTRHTLEARLAEANVYRLNGRRRILPFDARARRLLRRHRLWELFLTEVLGLPWDEVHVEAHRLEHATSDRVAERLAAFLRQPAADPHGQPIPAGDGQFPARQSVPLLEAEVGRRVQVVEVPDGDAGLLRRLAAWHLIPGAAVTLLERDDVAGTVRVRAAEQERLLEAGLAARLQVAAVSPGDD